MTEEQMLKEIKDLKYLYNLKRVIRYQQERNEAVRTESVAEHICSMLVLANYFLPKEDPNKEMDWLKVHQMILWHDLSEVEFKDIHFSEKTDEDRKEEERALEVSLEKVPVTLKETIVVIIEEYEKRESKEAQFAQAIDKFDPCIELAFESEEVRFKKLGVTEEKVRSKKDSIIKPFPHIFAMHDYLLNYWREKNYYANQ